LSAEARRDAAIVPEACDQATAEQHIIRLFEAGRLTAREAAILRAVVAREVLALPLPLRDRIRAAVLRAGVLAAMRVELRGSASARLPVHPPLEDEQI
jgi:transcriptional regulator CtsR